MDIQRSGSGSALQHWERFAPALLARAFLEKVAELVPGIARLDLIFQRHNRNVIVGAAFGADATAYATFGDVDLAAGQARDSGAAAQHAHGVLALTTRGRNADIANDHALAVHT